MPWLLVFSTNDSVSTLPSCHPVEVSQGLSTILSSPIGATAIQHQLYLVSVCWRCIRWVLWPWCGVSYSNLNNIIKIIYLLLRLLPLLIHFCHHRCCCSTKAILRSYFKNNISCCLLKNFITVSKHLHFLVFIIILFYYIFYF